MKNFKLNLTGLHGSPNQTGETLTRENRLGIVTCLNPLRTLCITLLLLTLGTGQMWGTKTFYLYPNSNWHTEADGVSPRFAIYYTTSSGNNWVSMTTVSGATNWYKGDVPDDVTLVIFCRMKGNSADNKWDNKYNQSQDITGSDLSSKYKWTIKDWGTAEDLNAGIENNGTNDANGIWYYNGSDTKWAFNGKNAQSKDLGDVTTLYLKQWFTYLYQNRSCYNKNTVMRYNVHRTTESIGAYSSIDHNWESNYNTWSDGYNKPSIGHNNQNINLLSGLGSGNYTMSFHYYDPDMYITGPTHSLNWTIAPPSISSPTCTSNGAGDGASGTPFTVAVGSDLTLTVSGSQASSDANSVLQAKFGDDAYSTTLTHTLSNLDATKHSITVKARYYNSADDLSGTEQTWTIYYQGVSTPSIAVSSVTKDASTVTAANTGETVTINASRQNAGTASITYQYSPDNSSWTTIGSSTATTQSWTLPAATATTTYYLRAQMTYDAVTYTSASTQFKVYGKKTIKVKNTNNWSSVLMHRWGGDRTGTEWPGEATQISNVAGQWKQIVLYSSNTSFALVDGTTNSNHTADQTYASITDGECYQIQSGTGSSLTLSSATCPSAPTVTTNSVSTTSFTSATVGGNITNDGNDIISDYGYYYSTNSSLSSSNLGVGTQVSVGTDDKDGSYSNSQTGLEVGTTYYVIAYASNPHGTGYGSVVSFSTTEAALSLESTVDYEANTITITPTTNLTSENGFTGVYYVCASCESKPAGATELTMNWNGTTKKLEISGATANGDYTFNVKLKPSSNCSGDAYNNADAEKTITMKTIPDYHTLTPTTAIIGSTYMNGSGTSESPYFVYSSHFEDAKTLTLNISGVGSSDDVYCAVDGAGEQAMTGSGTSRTATITLPSNSIGTGKTTTVTVYAKVDGQTPASGKMATATVYYTVSANPVVTVTATYNGEPLPAQIPQNAEITVAASVSNIPGEPTFVYSKGSGAYTSTTTYTIDAAGTTTMHAKTSYLGDWIGNLDVTTYAANSVTLTTTKTDMYGDASSTSVSRLFMSSGEEYTAPDIEGYTFSGWSCNNANVQVSDDSGTSWKSTSSNATVYVKASAAGGTLTANYTENKRIYFDNSRSHWEGDIYVYLFSGDSWYNNYNSSDQNGPGVVPRINQIEYGQMTQIGESDIYYYEYSTAASFSRVAFSIGNQNNYSHLYATHGVWRADYSTCNPCYVAPETSDQTKYDNGDSKPTYYFNNGYWRRYMPKKSGYSLYFTVSDDGVGVKGDFVPENPGVDGENFILELERKGNFDYYFNINNSCTSKSYGNNGKMSKDNCTDWTFTQTSESVGNCGLTTTAEGTYIFRLSTANGQLKLSVEYPLNTGDYRVSYTDNTGHNDNYSDYIRMNTSEEAKKDTTSFFVKKTAAPAYTIERCTGFDGSNNPTWETAVSAQTITVDKDSVYIFVFEQPAGGASISKVGQDYYSGNFYVRTDAAGGGWNNYRSNSDNKMKHTDKPSALAAHYNYYYVKWVGDAAGNSNSNVKFTVANDYNSSVSQEYGNDPADGSLSAGQNLTGKGANVRFTYNTMTNEMTRTCIGGSGHDAQYLVINGTSLKTSGNSEWPGRTAMEDQNDWIYTLNLKAADDATITLETHYNGKFVTLLNSEKILDVNDGEYYDIRIIYDYKTNQVVASYIPSTTVASELKVDVDIMFIRKAKDNHIKDGTAAPTTLSLSGSGKITGAEKTLYGAIEFEKDYVRGEGAYSGLASNRPIRSTYWISFPFDVRVKDIFGLGNYTETWILQRYRGDLRAQKGWFLDTKTFWEYILDENFVLEAGKGYALSIDCEAIQWPNGRSVQYLYFPSLETIKDIESVIPNASIAIEALPCNITSPADRRNKDSNWNIIGIPAFTTGWGEAVATVNTYSGDNDFKYFYEWNSASNTLEAESAKKFNFEFMHSYMVQYAGTINWTIDEPSPVIARRTVQAYPEEMEFRLNLMKGEEEADHTFVTLMGDKKISTDFDMNSDLVKMLNAKTSNIYTIINSDVQVAANCLPMSDKTTVVPVGVQIATTGEYTFAMPEGTNGTGVVLVDTENGTRTNLALGDYTVTLGAGTTDGRFVLEISPVANTPTGIDEVPSDQVPSTNVRKVMVDGVLYIVKDGKAYDARGTRVK